MLLKLIWLYLMIRFLLTCIKVGSCNSFDPLKLACNCCQFELKSLTSSPDLLKGIRANAKNIKKSEAGLAYRISSYKALPRIIPAILTFLCIRNVVFSNKTRIWGLFKIIITAGLIWGNTVFSFNMKPLSKEVPRLLVTQIQIQAV